MTPEKLESTRIADDIERIEWEIFNLQSELRYLRGMQRTFELAGADKEPAVSVSNPVHLKISNTYEDAVCVGGLLSPLHYHMLTTDTDLVTCESCLA